MPGTVLVTALQILSHLIFDKPCKIKYYYPHFMDEAAGSVVDSSKVTGLRSGVIRFQTQMGPQCVLFITVQNCPEHILRFVGLATPGSPDRATVASCPAPAGRSCSSLAFLCINSPASKTPDVPVPMSPGRLSLPEMNWPRRSYGAQPACCSGPAPPPHSSWPESLCASGGLFADHFSCHPIACQKQLTSQHLSA